MIIKYYIMNLEGELFNIVYQYVCCCRLILLLPFLLKLHLTDTPLLVYREGWVDGELQIKIVEKILSADLTTKGNLVFDKDET